MASKYVDSTAIMQVIGCVYNDASILDKDDTYYITEADFVEDFHKIVFGTLYKLHENGVNKFTIEAINDFLDNHPKKKAIFDLNRGNDYLNQISTFVTMSTFDYYYKRMKKMTLLRMYDNYGIDVSFLYDPDNILDTKKKEAQEEWLDNVSLQTIAD